MAIRGKILQRALAKNVEDLGMVPRAVHGIGSSMRGQRGPIGAIGRQLYHHPKRYGYGVASLGITSAIAGGGKYNGSNVSQANQNSYAVRAMRRRQSSAIAGFDPRSIGGFS